MPVRVPEPPSAPTAPMPPAEAVGELALRVRHAPLGILLLASALAITALGSIGVALYLATCAYAGFYLLSIGTSIIAPYAENHSTLRRLISLIVTIAAAVLGSMDFTDNDVLPLIPNRSPRGGRSGRAEPMILCSLPSPRFGERGQG